MAFKEKKMLKIMQMTSPGYNHIWGIAKLYAWLVKQKE